jgi:hypothetical protein
MKETVTSATKAFILTTKMKAFIAFFSLLLVGGGLYVLADPAGQSIVTAKDPYTLDIQNRAQTINNAVLGVIDAQKTQPAYKFRTTCEDAVFLIRKKNLEAEQENLKLTPDQRTLNQKYKAFLHEAYIVVDDCYNGKQADLTKMNATKKYIIS